MNQPSSSTRKGHDVLVLGAGIVGTSTALHLQQRGLSVCLVDWQQPGSGTSHGNAGLIERASVVPYSFPQSPLALLRYAANRQTDVHFQWRALPAMAGWLWRYWRESAPQPLERAAQDMLPLIERCVTEHDAFIQAASLQHLVRPQGWIDIYREPAAFAAAAADARAISSRYGLQADILDGQALAAREPAFLPQANMAGGIHWLAPWTVSAPGKLVQGYADLFCQRGGALVHADARGLRENSAGWQLDTPNGTLQAAQAVIALGPDAPGLYRSLGYDLPLAHKRGYHLHFRPGPDTPAPQHPLCDSRAGFVLAPMEQGVRLTTGVELALSDAPPNRIQLDRAERIARRYWPLGTAVEAEPWMGRRPCTPDMRPIISAAPHHRGLWFNFGHAHHGLTLGPASGRLLAEMMTGEQTFTSPAPYSAHRFM
ncbi:FAD-binding oxidoreductase [Pseudomonas sp. S 311-6]|uniref:NAD(P)/FAD-dependent oxidoreductase n=1 Tax=Kerstersia gyiorum TaxID=206506 RepID=UPI002096820D|nr:FAD-binding oxidoreductase [Pseudomonas sp. S 311-6]